MRRRASAVAPAGATLITQAADNRAGDPDLGAGVGWAPTLYGERHPA